MSVSEGQCRQISAANGVMAKFAQTKALWIKSEGPGSLPGVLF
jgi:hypothetical protein